MRVCPAFFAPALRGRSYPIVATLLIVLALSVFLPTASGQRRHGANPLDTLGEEVSQEKGWEALKAFRNLGIAGEYRLSFQLRVMPRGEKTRTVPGLLLGTMTDTGPISRVDLALAPAEVSDKGELVPADVHRLLLQNGIFANAVEAGNGVEGDQPRPIDSNEYFKPIAGSDFTVFDLLMPFTYWQNFRYEGRTTLRSRPAHVFWMYPPKDDALMQKSVSGVRIFLDEEFNALIRVEIYDPEGEEVKTISVVSFKIVDGQGVLSQVDVRDESTRDKTRFKVLDAALNVELPKWVFQVEGLRRDVYGTELASVAGVDPLEDEEAVEAE